MPTVQVVTGDSYMSPVTACAVVIFLEDVAASDCVALVPIFYFKDISVCQGDSWLEYIGWNSNTGPRFYIVDFKSWSNDE